MLHPLTLPEIIERVGAFLSWSHGPDDSCIFCPRDLSACLRVNSTWYRALAPLLWAVFCDEWRIPADTAAIYSRHVRFAYLSQGPQLIPICSTKLRHLTLSHPDRMMDALNLVCSNKQLARLEWLAPFSSVRSADKNIVRFALSTVTSLISFKIDCWRDSMLDDVISIAQSNPGLITLELGSLVSLKVGSITKPRLLFSLAELRLESHWGLNPGIEKLVRLCPRLSTLWFRADSTCPYSALSQNLRESCPVLASLRCVEGPKNAQYGDVLHTGGISSLVKAPHFLIHLDLPVKHLTRNMCDALLDRHSSSLQSIRFHIRDADEEVFLCVKDILSACSNLIFFALDKSDSHFIDTCKQPWRADDVSAMLIMPWSCSKLKTLELTGIAPMCYLEDVYNDEGYYEYDFSNEQSEQGDSNSQDSQDSISEETTRDMDLDTDSQWTTDVVMDEDKTEDSHSDDTDTDMYGVYDLYMDIDPTPTELALDLLLQLLDSDSTHMFFDAFLNWVESFGWTLQTDIELCELAVKRDHKRLLIELFERLATMPTMDCIVMGGVKAVKPL